MKPAAADARFMARALELAARGLGRTFPNPPVGAVFVRGGRVVGEGTGASWPQVQSLLAHAAGDEDEHRRSPRRGAAATEARIDRELLVHGILPGDPRLYRDSDELTPDRSR